MKKLFIALLMLAMGSAALPLRADVLVLVHGYLSGSRYWDETGFSAVLQQHGWQRAGTYVAGPAGVQLLPVPASQSGDRFYAVDFPSEAPVLIQVELLRQVLAAVNANHAGEPITLVGHSAGGVVARTALVRGGAENVKTLITIASPHLGTALAEDALDVTDIPFPFSMMADFFGGEGYDTLMRSRSLYVDLTRPRPGNLLYWLNGQVHPEVKYISIVHGQTPAGWGDNVVPAYSQDMNNVPALQGRSSLIVIPAAHGLDPVDGSVVISLLGDTV